MTHQRWNQSLFHVELSLLSFRNYIRLVETNFQEKISVRRAQYREILKNIKHDISHEKEYQEELKDAAIDDMYEIEVEHIQRFRSSIIIQLFSFLEVELKRYCQIHHQLNNKEYSIHDLKGNNELDKIKKYLKQSAGFDLSKLPEWSFINDFRVLRNKIVHNASIIEFGHQDLTSIRNFSKNNFSLNSYSENTYEITLDNEKFIDLCVDQIQNFLKGIDI